MSNLLNYRLLTSGVAGIGALMLIHRSDMIIEFLRDLCFTSRFADSSDMVSRIDKFITENCGSSSCSFGSYIPNTGFHLYWGYTNVTIFYKYVAITQEGEKYRYRIYSLTNKNLDEIYDKIITSPLGEVNIHRLIHLTSWQHVLNSTPVKVPDIPYLYQSRLIDEIFAKFKQGESLTALICGDSGKGKSIIPRLLATKYRVQTMLVEGFHPTIPGVSFTHHILSKRNPDTLILLLIDDIELAFQKANSEEAIPNENTCHAYNKAEMCSLIQQLKDTPNIITICTTIIPLNKMIEDYGEYLRPGRFDIKCQF